MFRCRNGLSIRNSTGSGALSSTPGLVIDSITGGIDLAASTPGTYTVTYTIPASGGCTAFSWNTNVAIVEPGTWIGKADTNWQNTANWVCGAIPSATTNVTIDSGSIFYPVINSLEAVNNLSIQTGSSLTVRGGILQIAGSLSNAGTFDASAGTIEMNGSSPQTIPVNAFVNNNILNLIISNNVTLAGRQNLFGTLSFGNSNKTFYTNGLLTLKSTATGTAMVADITNGGINTGNNISGNVTVETFIHARRAWRLSTAPITNLNTIPQILFTMHAKWRCIYCWYGEH
ncbi:MAG: hypothetical protein WDM71_05915 [Ferruginibacter sp.]